MSQIYKRLTSSGPIPPVIATSYVEDVGSATPAANILNILGNDSTTNNDNGIYTTGSGNTVTAVISNRIQGTTSTSGAATSTIATFTPSVVGTYTMEFRISAYNTTSALGAGYSFFGSVRFDGVNSNICDVFDEIINEEGAMSGVDVFVSVSGANVLLRATGYALQNINWGAVGLYTFIGV